MDLKKARSLRQQAQDMLSQGIDRDLSSSWLFIHTSASTFGSAKITVCLISIAKVGKDFKREVKDKGAILN